MSENLIPGPSAADRGWDAAAWASMESVEQCTMPMALEVSRESWPAGVEALAHLPGTPFVGPQPTLAELTTLRVGGPVREYREAATEQEMIDAVREADERGLPLLVVGGGSNIVAADAGFEGIVIRDARQEVRVTADDRCGGVEIVATAGVTWDDLVRQAVASHWGGFEALSGIPGTVGAAPVQNIGAYGAEVAEVIASVRAWDRALGRVCHLPLADLHFSYRDSALKRSCTDAQVGGGRTWGPTGRWVVLSVTFLVRQASLSAPITFAPLAAHLGVQLGERVDARAVREAVIDIRRSKAVILDAANHDTWSAGSFFTNPILDPARAAALPEGAPRFGMADGRVKTSAAWLIEHAGMPRGYALGGANASRDRVPASLSTQHVLVLTNRGQARAADITALRDEVVAGVREHFGITLVPEPVHVGEFQAG